MTTIGPWQPEVETLREYIARLVSTAPPLSPEEVSRLAPLLRLGTRRGGDAG